MEPKRVRARRLKADILDRLSQDALDWDWGEQPAEDRHHLTEAEAEDVAQEVSGELYRRAVRLTGE